MVLATRKLRVLKKLHPFMHSSPFGALPLILSNERSAAGVQQQKRALFFSLLNTVDGKAFFPHRPDVKKF